MENTCEYATAGNVPFSDTQFLNIAFLLILKYEAYKDECKIWKARLVVEQNWFNFKAQFRQAYRERNGR